MKKPETIKCVITRYDNNIKEPPYLTLPLDEAEVVEPETDYLGQELCTRLTAVCRSKGYKFKFYTRGMEDYKYEANKAWKGKYNGIESIWSWISISIL